MSVVLTEFMETGTAVVFPDQPRVWITDGPPPGARDPPGCSPLVPLPSQEVGGA